MVDRYTKFVLTLIAGALVGIMLEHATPAAMAQPTPGICGDTQFRPCYVKSEIYSEGPLQIENALHLR